MRSCLKSLLVVAALAGSLAGGGAAGLDPVVTSWLAAQTNLQTWTADFVQTRMLKTLTQPLQATGHVWFAAPDKFRWELGNPPQTIALRAQSDLWVVYPKLKRAEQFPLTAAGPWRDALSLLEAGFPRSQAEMEAQYAITSLTVTNGVCMLSLQPRSAAARKMIPELRVDFDAAKLQLIATELQFTDGSRMRNEFSNQVLNPAIEPERFRPQIGPDFKIVNPLKR